ncbi:MAG: Signal peptidase I [Parcubacteria group bacterium GW2011_GWC1_38_6]|nr:MAG: Signal peptidase I [Parcubacteria group bacterium GW2011_GWC1_38_6]
MKSFFIFIWESLKIIIVALLIVVPVRYFLFQPFFVIGQSMVPNFNEGDYLIVDEISYRFVGPQRGDVIVFKYPENPTQRYIKRIIGLPGETLEIKNGKIEIVPVSSAQITLDESAYLSYSVETAGDINIALGHNEYFVLGDNRPLSSDSRKWGTLPRENIIGKVFLRAWPVSVFAHIESPSY